MKEFNIRLLPYWMDNVNVFKRVLITEKITFNTNFFANQKTGNINLKYNPTFVDEDYFLSSRA